MWFLLRAGLVIGVVSALAYEKRGGTLPDQASLRAAVQPVADLKAAVDGLPPEMRERVMKAGSDEIMRRIGAMRIETPSQDTLSAGDKHAPWRGTAAR